MPAATFVRRSAAGNICGGGGGGGWGSSLQLHRRCWYAACREEKEGDEGGRLPAEWRKAAYARLIKLADRLGNLDRIDSKVVAIGDGIPVSDAGVISQMQAFKSLARAFVWSSAAFSAAPEKKRGAIALKSLTGVCNLLEISAQQRKSVRLTISPQVTEHRIWRGAVEEVLRNLAAECQTVGHHRSPAATMAEQIAACCLRFMSDAAAEKETPLWMQLAAEKKAKEEEERRSWGEVLEMLGHLSACLTKEAKLGAALEKVEAMKEGLYQIRDLLVEREIGYKEARRQDCLVQKMLCRSLGHNSRCLFILILYYLYGGVADLEVDLCGLSGAGDRRVEAGKVLTSGDEKTVNSAMKQLNMVFVVLKLVWETAGMKGALDLRGHIWWSGAEQRSLIYRGNKFFVHDLKL